MIKIKTIWKFPFGWDSGDLDLTVGENPKVVHVGLDPTGTGDLPCLWIEHEVDLTVPHEARGKYRQRFTFFGTGQVMPDNIEHVGSVINKDGLVWHVYRKPS